MSQIQQKEMLTEAEVDLIINALGHYMFDKRWGEEIRQEFEMGAITNKIHRIFEKQQKK